MSLTRKRKSTKWKARLKIAAKMFVAAPVAADQNNAEMLDEFTVNGRAEQHLGTAKFASERMVGYDDIQMVFLLRVGELTEAIPGTVATQHFGTGKANHILPRGFNLDHGTGFAATADGVPLNKYTKLSC